MDKINKICKSCDNTIENVNDEIKLLESVNSDIKLFSFECKMYVAKVIYCYDGDTIHCLFKHDGEIYKHNIRMYGYDSPEIKPSKNIETKLRNKIIKDAKKSKEYLESLILNKCVYLYCGKFDKYGRILGVIKLDSNDDKSVNEMMIDCGYGKLYFGGTKN